MLIFAARQEIDVFSEDSSNIPNQDTIIALADAIFEKFHEKEFPGLCLRIGVDKDISDRLEGNFRNDTYHLVNYCVDTDKFHFLLEQVVQLRPPLKARFANLLSQTKQKDFPPQPSTPVTSLSKGAAIESCWEIIQSDNVEIRKLKEKLESPQQRLEIANGNIRIEGFLEELEKILHNYGTLQSQKKEQLAEADDPVYRHMRNAIDHLTTALSICPEAKKKKGGSKEKRARVTEILNALHKPLNDCCNSLDKILRQIS